MSLLIKLKIFESKGFEWKKYVNGCNKNSLKDFDLRDNLDYNILKFLYHQISTAAKSKEKAQEEFLLKFKISLVGGMQVKGTMQELRIIYKNLLEQHEYTDEQIIKTVGVLAMVYTCAEMNSKNK